jgi:hypothetical protein
MVDGGTNGSSAKSANAWVPQQIDTESHHAAAQRPSFLARAPADFYDINVAPQPKRGCQLPPIPRNPTIRLALVSRIQRDSQLASPTPRGDSSC